MEIVVKGLNVEVPEHYRKHVAEKLAKVERYDHQIIRADVELFHEPNRRQHNSCQRVEITLLSRGPVIRAEACGKDFYSALDAAVTRINSQLRRAADRRRVHRGRRTPVSVAAATAPLAAVPSEDLDILFGKPPVHQEGAAGVDVYDEENYLPGHIAREKIHSGEPITIDEALSQMELVGHDFYLFMDKESKLPSVVYRRRAYDYGVIRLAG